MEQYIHEDQKTKGLTITIQKQGRIRFNKKVCEKYKIHEYNYALLFYDAASQIFVIGLQKTKANFKGAFKLFKVSGGYIINTASFFKHYNLEHLKKTKNNFIYEDNNFFISF